MESWEYNDVRKRQKRENGVVKNVCKTNKGGAVCE